MLIPSRYLVLVFGLLLVLTGCPRAQDPADYTVPYGVELAPPRDAPTAGGVAQEGAIVTGPDTLMVAPGPEATTEVGERLQQQPQLRQPQQPQQQQQPPR